MKGPSSQGLKVTKSRKRKCFDMDIAPPGKIRRTFSLPDTISSSPKQSTLTVSAPTSPLFAPVFNPSEYYCLVKRGTRRWRGGPITETSYGLDITKDMDAMDPMDRQLQLQHVLEHAFRQILSSAPPNCTAQLYAVNPRLNKRCISTQRLPPALLSFATLAEEIAAVLQSDQNVELQETDFVLCLYHHKKDQVGWTSPNLRSRLEYNRQVWAASKTSLDNPISRRNKIPKKFQKMCVSLAIAKGLHLLHHPAISQLQLQSFGRSRECRNVALELMRRAKVHSEYGPVALNELSVFENILPSD